MKTWEIKIQASDEKTALKYLEMLTRAFELAVIAEQPMNFTSGENPEEGTKLICKLKSE